ncbi:hypothetical protein [Kitasatospora sp. NBC_01302]|nr:hypothetical protein OG294_14360 [Kitasatospora sp. NBC_01302]
MSTPPDEQPDPPAWPPPGDTAALEPDTLPEHPLRAQDVAALLPKEIG